MNTSFAILHHADGCWLVACNHKKQNQPVETPWGTTLGADSATSAESGFSLNDIIHNGELIMLTLTGPENYYDYHGRGMGLQYLLCERFAKTLGVSLRVEVCKDTADLVARLKNGDGDLAAFFLPKKVGGRGLLWCILGIRRRPMGGSRGKRGFGRHAEQVV